MNLLLNGCSFVDNYYYKIHYDRLLSASTVNLAKPGSSNRRIIRTTVDHVEHNPVDFVIIGLSFYDRQEGPFKLRAKDPWVSYNVQGMQAMFAEPEDFESTVEQKLIGDYITSRYRYDINEHYLEQLYLDLQMFAGYLRSKRIGFCVYNTCDRHHRNINLGPEFVPLDFVSNQFLSESGCQPYEKDLDLPVNARHFYGEDVILLVEYLVEHIKRNQLIGSRTS